MTTIKEMTVALILDRPDLGNASLYMVPGGASKISHDLVVPPGGDIEPGETEKECVIREAKEEAGITLESFNLNKIVVLDKFYGNTHVMRVHFYRTVWGGVPSDGAEFTPVKYPVDNLPYKRMFPSDIFWMQRALAATKPFGVRVRLSRNGKTLLHQPEIYPID